MLYLAPNMVNSVLTLVRQQLCIVFLTNRSL